MADSVRHRGPDDDGVWVDAPAGVALGFRRLAILDLSDAGAQPMVSDSGRYVLVFNGEIYNYQRVAKELGSRTYRGTSDTEVLLAAIEQWGLESAIARFIGMFAFALWDRETRKLSLVRDRLGVKPLHYALTTNGLSFASELRTLGGIDIDRNALALYARYGYVPAPYSIYRGIAKLQPGTILTIDVSGSAKTHVYWDAARIAEAAHANPFRGTEEEATDAVEELLSDAVRLRLIADVPLGLFLSAGIDSTIIAALMQREAGMVKTFTIGFSGGLPNEAPGAAAIARHLGTQHTEATLSVEDVLETTRLMPSILDEPLGDSSAIPTFLVSRMARSHVTVALSGDGGDELFGGYHRYFLNQRLTDHVARVPRLFRRPLGTALGPVARVTGSARLRGLGEALVLNDPLALYELEVTRDLLRVRDARTLSDFLTSRERWPKFDDPLATMMFLDAVTYLPDDILAKVDRMSMAVSLEVREPVLDHRVVELAWSIPVSMKTRGLQGKWLLRKLARRFVPESMIKSEKSGFGLPIEGWLRGPLREWASSLVAPERIAREGFFDPAGVRRVWNDGPVAGAEDVLWRLLMFQQWIEAHGRISAP
jgi:asparagine synthase (glutamine-hydrolysing)